MNKNENNILYSIKLNESSVKNIINNLTETYTGARKKKCECNTAITRNY